MQKFTTAGVAGLLDVFDLPRSVQEGEAKKVPSKVSRWSKQTTTPRVGRAAKVMLPRWYPCHSS